MRQLHSGEKLSRVVEQIKQSKEQVTPEKLKDRWNKRISTSPLMSDKLFTPEENFDIDDFILKEVPLKTEKEH